MDAASADCPGQCDQTSSASAMSEKAQQIVEGLNDKRKQDTVMLSEFKSALLAQVCCISMIYMLLIKITMLFFCNP